MTRSGVLAILRFLEDTRLPGLHMLEVEARDAIWMMAIALLRRHDARQPITISALAQSSGFAYRREVDHALTVKASPRLGNFVLSQRGPERYAHLRP